MIRQIPAHTIVAAFAVLALAAGTVSDMASAEEQAMAPGDAGADLRAEGFALTYDVYTGGLRAIRFDFEVDLSDPGYETRIRLQTSGIIGALFNWSLEASSTGDWQDGEIAPETYRTANVWRSRQRKVAIDYAADGARTVTAEPPYGEEDIKRVDPALIPGSVDPTTAVTALVLTSAMNGSCRPTTAVYDGRRRYDANLEMLPPRDLKPSAAAPFAGRVEGCRLTFERIAGFKPDRKRLQDLEVAIWLADIGVEPGQVPVRLELTTPWGDGFAHLVRARTVDGALVFGSEDDG
ncbi:MAG: DUF3108 domain-containing protein [Proteobacteria bacterium]|nr:DUF3108 domain-containing protein [Pseudomonadota bacterium]